MNEKEVNIGEGLLNKIKQFLFQYYLPIHDAKEADFHFTTSEVYLQLLKLYPSEDLTQDLVAQWLHEGGFTFYDFGEMKLEWLFKKTT